MANRPKPTGTPHNVEVIEIAGYTAVFSPLPKKKTKYECVYLGSRYPTEKEAEDAGWSAWDNKSLLAAMGTYQDIPANTQKVYLIEDQGWTIISHEYIRTQEFQISPPYFQNTNLPGKVPLFRYNGSTSKTPNLYDE